ncbi:hypothetical protein KP509_09G069500 [Ceratopteris richardii]|uniref:Elongation factor 1-gamma n=1 Tax=Ceratopteris richardii TaxID=49495 RepID=A0A8T2U7Y9_CERRI|nr:hypothetical protein KP509_09G069500 [Ceratopteris richardii]
MAMILHSTGFNKNAFKGLIAAEYVGVKVELPKEFQFGVSNKTPEYLKLNPFGKVPVLETPEGPLFESNAIARYIARLNPESGLFGCSSYEEALVEQWIDVATTEVDANLSRWVYPLLGFSLPYSAEVKFCQASVKRTFSVLNEYLASKTYLVGHTVTLADIIMACNMLTGIKVVFTKEFLAEYPHLERYFWTIANQPYVKKFFGELSLPEKAPSPPTKQANVGKEEKKAKAAKPKEAPKPVVAAKPKDEAPAPKEVPEVDEEEEKPKAKPKNPLDLLPPSPMIMDEWKRLYSNTKAKEFREVAIEGFWKMYDPEGYSLWFCDYKYNEENTVTFVTMNKVSGFLQRMDLIRKHGFAKMCIFGESAPYKIKGVWLFRGKEIPQMVLDECYDVELYEWSKVDITDEAQKERVNAYFEEPDEFDGEKLLEAKCFK